MHAFATESRVSFSTIAGMLLAVVCESLSQVSKPGKKLSTEVASPTPETDDEEPVPDENEISPGTAIVDKWTLWIDGPHLRSTNIFSKSSLRQISQVGPGS